MKNKKIIILGSKGFIGKNLHEYLLKKKIQVLGISRKEIDFLSKDSSHRLKKIISDGDILVNSCAVAPCRDNKDFLINMKIISNIQKAISHKHLKKYINISSDAIYPDINGKLNEKINPLPESYHGLMHLNREFIINNSCSKKTKINHLRPTLIYGIGDTHNGYGPNLFLTKFLKNEKVKIFGHGEERRDHICIKDVVKIIDKVISKNLDGNLNIATGRLITFYEIANEFKKINNKFEIYKVKRKGKMPHNGYRAFNNKKLKLFFPNLKLSSFKKNLIEMINKSYEKN